MLNDIGLPGLLFIIVIFVGIFAVVIRPAMQRAKENSTNVMFEISPIFWIICGLGAGFIGIQFYTSASSTSFLQQAAMSGNNPLQMRDEVQTIGMIGLILGGILIALGLARAILVPSRPSRSVPTQMQGTGQSFSERISRFAGDDGRDRAPGISATASASLPEVSLPTAKTMPENGNYSYHGHKVSVRDGQAWVDDMENSFGSIANARMYIDNALNKS